MSLEDEVIEIIAEYLHIEKANIRKDYDLTNDLGADSLTKIEIEMELEEKYKISIPDDESAKLNTVENIITYISNNYKKP